MSEHASEPQTDQREDPTFQHDAPDPATTQNPETPAESPSAPGGIAPQHEVPAPAADES